MLHPYYRKYLCELWTQPACPWLEMVCFSGCIACDLNQALCFLPKLCPSVRKPQNLAQLRLPPSLPSGSACSSSCITTPTTVTDSFTALSPHITTAQGREIPRTWSKGGTVSKQWRILSSLLLKKTLSSATGSAPHPPKAQCVFADFDSLVSSVNSVMGISWVWVWPFSSFIESPPTAPSHYLSMHQKGWQQTDKYYIYNMNIYSNFNGLLMDFFVHLVLIYCIWFILVMRNNIMFCGFFFLFFFCWIIINIIICCMVFMNTHKENTHIGQNQTSNTCCSFFEKSDVWLWAALSCFLITKFSSSLTIQKPGLQFSQCKHRAPVMYQEGDADVHYSDL